MPSNAVVGTIEHIVGEGELLVLVHNKFYAKYNLRTNSDFETSA